MYINKQLIMKKLPLFLSLVLMLFFSCKKKKVYPTYQVMVQLIDTAGANFTEATGVTVKLTTSGSNNIYEASSNATGLATFIVPAGIYTASASHTVTSGAQKIVYNGVADNSTTVANDWVNTTITKVKMRKAQLSQIVIKELFIGGTPKDDGSGAFSFDGYVILYNNSDAAVTVNNLCMATVSPANAQGTNNYYGTDGKLIYESANWIPALSGFWYMPQSTTIPAGKQIVIATRNAVNNTITYSKSINFDNAEYYATYDIASAYNNSTYYVAPVASIPASHYMKAAVYGTGNAWLLSNTSPGLFIFETKGTTPAVFGADASKTHILNGSSSTTSKMVPVDWILDGVEGYLLNNTANKKRILTTIDAGYVYHTNSQGYSIYRNVDKAATEAITTNTGKLVYNYSLGTTSVGGSTDQSGIDAEASIKNGARIVYKDGNNSTDDFHLRSKASLRTN